jgi:hypothetical protein
MEAGQTQTIRLRLCVRPVPENFGADFDDVFHEFYEAIAPKDLTSDERLVQRQASPVSSGESSSITTTCAAGLRGDPAGPG